MYLGLYICIYIYDYICMSVYIYMFVRYPLPKKLVARPIMQRAGRLKSANFSLVVS